MYSETGAGVGRGASVFTHALSKYDVWSDWENLAVLALIAFPLSRAYALLAFWSLAKFLQAASLDSRACRGMKTQRE